MRPSPSFSYGIRVVFVNDFAFPRHVSLVGLGLPSASAPPQIELSVCDSKREEQASILVYFGQLPVLKYIHLCI